MPLESLIQLIETLQQRIQEHGDALRQSEMLTRYVLVDPLLRGLGWDTENPDQVRPEFRTGPGAADYALLSGGKPIIMVEAKKLDTPLQNGLTQSINYCLQDGTPYFAVTDGRRWEVYETHKPVPIDEKRVVAFDVADPVEAVLKSIALWRPSVETGKVVLPQPPLIAKQATTSSPVQTTFSPTPAAVPSPTQLSNPASTTGWTPLSQLQPSPGDAGPKTLRLPDNSQVSVGTWTNMVVQVVRWLSTNGTLTPANGKLQNGSKYVLNDTPVHPDGKPFRQDKQVNSLHLNVHYNARAQCRNARLILEHLGQDSNQFFVLF